MPSKKTSKKSKKETKKLDLRFILPLIGVVIVASILGVTLNINVNIPEETYTAQLELSEEQLPALVEDDMGELIEIEEVNGDIIPTVEEVDGGQFEDEITGLSLTEGEYEDLGWSETYNVSSPNAFMQDTIGKCIIANNRYGAQCVSLARVFWWSYADRDVSTCGTGMAKGMMECAEQNAGNEFEIHWSDEYKEIQAGDWLVFNGGQYGHVGMSLGEVNNGYVALLGENQGGHSCGQGVGGAATNIINISIKNLIGFYRPKAYIKPKVIPITPDTSIVK